MKNIRVIFLPYFKDNPYQDLLASHLEKLGIEVKRGWVANYLSLKIRQWDPDILHLHWLHSFFNKPGRLETIKKFITFFLRLIILKLKGLKIVWTLHEIESHDNPYRFLDWLSAFFVCRISDAIIIHSKVMEQQVLTTYRFKKNNKIHVIPHANYVAQYDNSVSRQEARKTLGIPDSTFLLLYFGRIKPYKGVLELIGAFRMLDQNNIKLFIVGSADQWMERRVREKIGGCEAIEFVGDYVPDTDVQVYMNAADVCVFPFQDIMTSSSVMLAMSFGKPCILPKMGDMIEILDDEGAFLYDPGGEYGLQKAIECAIQKRDDLVRMGQHNLKLAEKWGWDKTALMTAEVYGKILDKA